MPSKKTVINFVLDESGSMGSVREATISGFNEYVDTVKSQHGKNATLTLTKFGGDRVETILQGVKLLDVKPLTHEDYTPNGGTPLYDAIAQTIHRTEADLSKMRGKPSVICVIMTDGHENASQEYNRARILELIQRKTAEGWAFAYLGADQDAWTIAESIGVASGSAVSYSASAPGGAMAAAGLATSGYMARGGVVDKGLFADVAESKEFKRRAVGVKVTK